MTRWCPVCESPGRRVARRSGPTPGRDEEMVIVSERLPGIAPTHICTRCLTVFSSRDRFYLRTRHGEAIHGIAVWPHGRRWLHIEVGDDGLVIVFDDSASVLLPGDDLGRLMSDFFSGYGVARVRAWATRRGFSLRVITQRAFTDLVVEPPGPHFALLVTKSWFQRREIRSTEAGIAHIESIGIEPVLFPPTAVLV